jgi:hypothetical protein
VATRPELTEEIRAEAIAYVDAVIAAAEGAEPQTALAAAGTPQRKHLLTRLVPRSVKRAYVRLLVYALKHPFDHLAHPLQIRLEEEIGQARGVAHAALTRAENTSADLRRLRTELERERRPR